MYQSHQTGKRLIGDTTNPSGPGPYIMAANTLTGNKVVNESGEDLGTLKHIMLDVVGGTIPYAVLSFGGVLGLGDKLFAVPWSSLALDVDNERFVLNIAKDRLQGAPGFDKNDWPDMADDRWRTEVSGYYGPAAPQSMPFI